MSDLKAKLPKVLKKMLHCTLAENIKYYQIEQNGQQSSYLTILDIRLLNFQNSVFVGTFLMLLKEFIL
jgi:hypothetical protein